MEYTVTNLLNSQLNEAKVFFNEKARNEYVESLKSKIEHRIDLFFALSFIAYSSFQDILDDDNICNDSKEISIDTELEQLKIQLYASVFFYSLKTSLLKIQDNLLYYKIQTTAIENITLNQGRLNNNLVYFLDASRNFNLKNALELLEKHSNFVFVSEKQCQIADLIRLDFAVTRSCPDFVSTLKDSELSLLASFIALDSLQKPFCAHNSINNKTKQYKIHDRNVKMAIDFSRILVQYIPGIYASSQQYNP